MTSLSSKGKFIIICALESKVWINSVDLKKIVRIKNVKLLGKKIRSYSERMARRARKKMADHN